VLPWEHRGQPGCSSSLKIPHPAARSSLPLAARPRSAAGKAAGGLPAAAMPRKAGLSRLVAGPVTLALLAAELMKAPKLREPASASLPSPSPGRVWALGLFLAVGERRGDRTGHGAGTASPQAGCLPRGMSGDGMGLSLCEADQGGWVPAGAEGSSGGTRLYSSLWVRIQLSLAARWVGCGESPQGHHAIG